MAVSISFIMAFAIAVATAVAAIVAFIPTYGSGISSTEAAIEELRVNIVGRVDNGVANFFKGPSQVEKTIASFTTSGVEFASGSVEQVTSRMCHQIRDNKGVTTSTMYLLDNMYMCDNRFGTYLGGIFNASTMTVYPYHFDVEAGRFQRDSKGEMIPFAMMRSFVLNNTRLFYTVTQYKQAAPQRRWMEAHAGFNNVQYSVYTYVKGTSGADAALTFDILPEMIGELLASLGLRQRARALAVDTQTQHVIGTSWGQKAIELLQWMDLERPTHERMRFFEIPDLNDTLVTKMYNHLGGKQLFNQHGKINTTMGSGKDKVFVDVTHFTNPEGMDIRILLAMPEIDFLEDTYASRDRTIGAVCGALGGLICLAIVFSILIARPLHRLGDRMYKTASLQDDDADDAPSILSEVRSMQEAYTTMKQELNRMKSYLPQSVLCAMYDEDEVEEGDASPSESASESHGVMTVQSVNSKASGSTHNETASLSSHCSSRVSRSKTGTVVAGLNTAKSVVSKRVVVVAFNLCGFQKRLEGGRGAKDLPELQARFLTLVNKHVRENKGVVDTFQGDHILASFNAVSNVVSAPKRAALAAMHACQEAAKDPELPPVSVGISAGVAFVGNMGNSDMQRFNIVGPVYVEALMMERLAREQLASSSSSSSNSSTATTKPWRILGLGNIIQDISLEFYYCCCDIVHCPGAKNKLEIAISMERLKSVATGEWMYMLEEGANADPFVEINDAFAHALESDGETAMQAMSAASSKIASGGHDGENASSPAEQDTTATIATALSRLHVLMSFAGKDGEGIAAEATKVAFIGTE